MLSLLFLLPLLSWCQEDPCSPNPCGANTRCASSYSGTNPVISCECLIGYRVPDGGDPFDGCIAQSAPSGTSRGGGSAGMSPPRPTVSSTTTEVPIAPLSTMGSVRRESDVQPAAVPRSLDTDDTSRLQAGKRPGQLVPRRKTKPNVVSEDIDTKELFPEGIHKPDYRDSDNKAFADCLVHEDCEENEFCSPPPENQCVDACTLDGKDTTHSTL